MQCFKEHLQETGFSANFGILVHTYEIKNQLQQI